MEKNKLYIGGSTIAAVMGLSRWKTPLQLWAEMTGKIEREDISQLEHVKLGTELEDFVAKKFEKETGMKVSPATLTYTHPEYPYMVAHIDRLIEEDNMLLECKTCSAWKAKEWEGEDIPQEYILQVMWYLGILNRQNACIACLIGGQKFVWKRVSFDKELFDKMVEAAKNFMEINVQKDIAPMATANDNEALPDIYAQHNDQMQQATADFEIAVTRRQELKMHIDEMSKELKEFESLIKQVIGEGLGILTEKYKVTWKQYISKSVDTQKMKDDLIYDMYAKQTVSRRLLVQNRND